MLEHHDEEAPGGHSNARDTVAKLGEVCWWPSMEAGVRRWVETCFVCKASKPQKGLTTEERMELYEGQIKNLIVDSFGSGSVDHMSGMSGLDLGEEKLFSGIW